MIYLLSLTLFNDEIPKDSGPDKLDQKSHQLRILSPAPNVRLEYFDGALFYFAYFSDLTGTKYSDSPSVLPTEFVGWDMKTVKPWSLSMPL